MLQAIVTSIHHVCDGELRRRNKYHTWPTVAFHGSGSKKWSYKVLKIIKSCNPTWPWFELCLIFSLTFWKLLSIYVTYKCSVLTSMKTIYVHWTNRLVMEITSISWENHTRSINILCGQNVVSSCYTRQYLYMQFFHLTGGGIVHAVSSRYTRRYMQFLHVTPGGTCSFFTLH